MTELLRLTEGAAEQEIPSHRDLCAAVLRGCNVPPSFVEHSLARTGRTGAVLRRYLTATDGSDTSFREDCVTGKGILLSGNAAHRLPVFYALAKELLYAQHQLFGGTKVSYFLSLRWLTTLMTKPHPSEADSEVLALLERCGALFITSFYDATTECPYTPAELSHVADFLHKKLAKGTRLYLSSSSDVQGMLWWPGDLRAAIAEKVREVVCAS